MAGAVQIRLPGRECLKIAPCTSAKARFYWSSLGNLTDKLPGLGLRGEKVQHSGAEELVQCACWHSCLTFYGRGYETSFAAGLLKWRNRAMVMDTFFFFFESNVFCQFKVLINYPLVLFCADVSHYSKKFNFLISKNM